MNNNFWVEQVERDLYESQIANWFKGQGWEAAPTWDDLPTTCYVVYDKEATASAFTALYLTNSSIAIQDWTVVNPKCHPYRRIKALSFLCKKLNEIVINFNKKKIIHFVVPDNLTEYLCKREGYAMSEKAAILFKDPHIMGE